LSKAASDGNNFKEYLFFSHPNFDNKVLEYFIMTGSNDSCFEITGATKT
jgi:hypothetical protein